jgi:hypothetical protein
MSLLPLLLLLPPSPPPSTDWATTAARARGSAGPRTMVALDPLPPAAAACCADALRGGKRAQPPTLRQHSSRVTHAVPELTRRAHSTAGRSRTGAQNTSKEPGGTPGLGRALAFIGAQHELGA